MTIHTAYDVDIGKPKQVFYREYKSGDRTALVIISSRDTTDWFLIEWYRDYNNSYQGFRSFTIRLPLLGEVPSGRGMVFVDTAKDISVVTSAIYAELRAGFPSSCHQDDIIDTIVGYGFKKKTSPILG